jgi:hypothetical protein
MSTCTLFRSASDVLWVLARDWPAEGGRDGGEYLSLASAPFLHNVGTFQATICYSVVRSTGHSLLHALEETGLKPGWLKIWKLTVTHPTTFFRTVTSAAIAGVQHTLCNRDRTYIIRTLENSGIKPMRHYRTPFLFIADLGTRPRPS